MEIARIDYRSISDHRMKKNELKQQVAAAIQACLEKKAEELSILEMEKGSGAFTDYFVLCSGTNPRQVLASGTGEPAISLASRVGAQGHVTALDLSPGLLEIAAQRARARGLTNFTTQPADAHSLPFPDNSFDLATSRFGVMFFGDPRLALQELRRVLRPGARACFLAWGPFDQPYWQSMMGIVHRHVGGPLLQPDAP